MEVPANKDFLTEEFFIKQRNPKYVSELLDKDLMDKADAVTNNSMLEI